MFKPQAEGLFEDLAPGEKRLFWLPDGVATETTFLPLHPPSGSQIIRGFPTYPSPDLNLMAPILGQANPSSLKRS